MAAREGGTGRVAGPWAATQAYRGVAAGGRRSTVPLGDPASLTTLTRWLRRVRGGDRVLQPCRRSDGTVMVLGHEPEGGRGPVVLRQEHLVQQCDDNVVGGRLVAGDLNVRFGAPSAEPAG